MNFAEAIKKDGTFTHTENGAVALNTTGNKLLDLYSVIGALRDADDTRIERLFADAYSEDPLMATKIVYYGRDIKCGMGERDTFRTLIRYMAKYHPETLVNNIELIPEYGRFDDWYSLIDTPLEDNMWFAMKEQFESDLKNYMNQKPISLLAKWIKTADASSEKTRKLGILTAQKLGYQVYNFKRIIRSMRKYINVTEGLMSTNQWDKIEYSTVPSKAMLNYRNAFYKHDFDRYNDFINKAVNGKAKINSSTLYPYDLIGKVWVWNNIIKDDVVEAQWRQLPNYVEPGTNALVMADTSGSMNGRPIQAALGLAIYFAERNIGVYHNMWMSFSLNPQINILKGETLYQKLSSINMSGWQMNTNLKAAFMKVLDIAIENHVSQEEMPKSIIVISDMEIDNCGDKNWSFYDNMVSQYKEYGYDIPNIIFWNVNSRHDVYHVDANRKGVQLIGGSSATAFKNLIDCIGFTPIEAMCKVINSERYAPITINK